MTAFAIAAALAVVVAEPGRPADPPVARPPAAAEAKKDGDTKEQRRPVSKADFAELAKDGPLPPWMPFGKDHTMVNVEHIDGTVVAVSREGIEIRRNGETVKYQPHTLLDTGAVCHWEMDALCYLLDDVQKGDVVMLKVGTVDAKKGAECFCLVIKERPGGVIPASRKPSWPKPHHVQQQNRIDARRYPKAKEEEKANPPAEEKKK